MLWGRKQNNIIQSVKTTYKKNADKREWDDTDRIYLRNN